MSKSILIYTTGNNIHRRYITSSTDPTARSLISHVKAGESYIIVDTSELASVHPHEVLASRGIQPAHSGQLVPVDALGNVGHPILGDHHMPDVIAHAASNGVTLIQSDVAGHGWTWNAASGFSAPG